jgi:predicted O-methyltransferase YrrM
MSKDSTPVGHEHFAYIAAHTTREDPFLRELRVAAAAAGLPSIHIAPEQAAFLGIVLRAANVRTVVEVGTLGGYSAIAMARALPTVGRVRTIELEPRHAEFAREWIAKSDVADRIEVLVGAAAEVMPTLPAGSTDAVFIDADKQGYPVYLQEGLRLLRPGGLVLADNVLAGGKVVGAASTETAVAIRRFNDLVARTAGLRSVIVPLGDGCLLGVKD